MSSWLLQDLDSKPQRRFAPRTEVHGLRAALTSTRVTARLRAPLANLMPAQRAARGVLGVRDIIPDSKSASGRGL
jgi:hypothetical protein